jgi:predicted TIM-barrel fold metal-dependent hydrolase
VQQTVISADSHLDLGWLPADTFTSRMDPSWGDRIPHVVETPDGQRWISGDVDLAGVGGVGSTGRPYLPGRSKRADRMAGSGLYDEGSRRPGDPEGRLADQDRDGVMAEVIYGLHSVAPRVGDPELTSALCLAFNDFLAEFCSAAPDRLVGLGCLPIHDPTAAAAELLRCAALGYRGVVLDIKNADVPIHDEAWDPLWAAATDCMIPVSFHLGARRPAGATSALAGRTPAVGKQLRDAALGMALLQYLGAADYFAVLFGGALDRFPTLQVVLAESGIGWIPHLLERLDYVVDNDFGALGLELRPSAYWHRQMYATFSKDEVGLRLIDELGESRIMFASDYPHPDGIFPDSLDHLERQTQGLAAKSREGVAWRNAADLYGITIATRPDR